MPSQLSAGVLQAGCIDELHQVVELRGEHSGPHLLALGQAGEREFEGGVTGGDAVEGALQPLAQVLGEGLQAGLEGGGRLVMHCQPVANLVSQIRLPVEEHPSGYGVTVATRGATAGRDAHVRGW